MLSQITLTNFFSLRDQALLDFKAINNRMYKNNETIGNTFTEDGVSLLKTIAIFGANASGKTNILKAIGVCVRFIRDSHSYTESTPKIFEPFKFYDNSRPSHFEIEFMVDGEKYEYGFGLMGNMVVEEYLYSYPKKYRALVFRRHVDDNGGENYSFSKKFSRPKEVVSNTSKHTLFLTRAALMNRPEALKIYNFISSKIIVGLPSFEGADFENMLRIHKEDMIKALKYADSDIVNYEFIDNPEAIGAKRFVTFHKGDPSKPFNFDTEESAGTRRLLRLLAAFINAAENNMALIVDELEASLHPQLVKYAVKRFNKSAKAQLIFTTHDLSLMDIEILRPDQIYFAAKNYNDGSSDVYSLSDFTEYKNYKNVRKDYEQGRFDAIPYLPSF